MDCGTVSASDEFKWHIHCNFEAVPKDNEQVDFKINLAPHILNAGARVVPGQYHVDRQLHIPGHIAIAHLDQLYLGALCGCLRTTGYLLHSEHLHINGSYGRLGLVDDYHPI